MEQKQSYNRKLPKLTGLEKLAGMLFISAGLVIFTLTYNGCKYLEKNYFNDSNYQTNSIREYQK
jgi:hypothetical protein